MTPIASWRGIDVAFYYDVIPQPRRDEYFAARETIPVAWTSGRYTATCPVCGKKYRSIYRGNARNMCYRHMVKHYVQTRRHG